MKNLVALFLLFLVFEANAQKSDADSTANFWGRIFLPSIEVGYQIPNSSQIGSSVKFGTSIEYRFRNNNDFFLRLNYDTYGAKYSLSQENGLSNNIDGTVQFTDLLFGPGYRFGDKTYRLMFSVMPGIKTYEFPSATLSGQQVLISQESRTIFTTYALGTLEYYFDEKSAFTLSLFQNEVWEREDFWQDGTSAWGFSVGFITSLL